MPSLVLTDTAFPDEKHSVRLSEDVSRYSQRFPSPSVEPFQSSASISLPTLDSIPQSARHQRRAAMKYSSSGSTPTTGHVPRPRNAYVLYRSWALSYDPSLVGSRTTNKQDVLSRMTGELWNAESDEVRAHFATLAAEEKERHAEKYPGYSFMPKQICREGNTRQRVRSRRKKYDDVDDYAPSVRSPSPFLSNPRYSPYASSPSGSTSSSDHHFSSPSSSLTSLEECSPSKSLTSQSVVDDVYLAKSSYPLTAPGLRIGCLVEPDIASSSPSVSSSDLSWLSQVCCFISRSDLLSNSMTLSL